MKIDTIEIIIKMRNQRIGKNRIPLHFRMVPIDIKTIPIKKKTKKLPTYHNEKYKDFTRMTNHVKEYNDYLRNIYLDMQQHSCGFRCNQETLFCCG